MAEKLFTDFEKISSKQWKQQIQYDLKGADYNDTLIWESPEGIKIKPFYHADETPNSFYVSNKNKAFQICQNIFVFDVEKSVRRSIETLQRGAESLRFTIQDKNINVIRLLETLPIETTVIYFNLQFLCPEFVKKINEIAKVRNATFYVQIDPIGQLAKEGNWFANLKSDFEVLNLIKSTCPAIHFLSIDGTLYQNAGATMVQQIAYIASHVTEYFNRIDNFNGSIVLEVAVGSHYFFEIAKLRALRLVLQSIASEFNPDVKFHILTTPSKRNKTLYDYNVNMLRTTTECMSAILGESDAVSNLPYDVLYHKENEFGDRISRNQLLVLKNESYFDKVTNKPYQFVRQVNEGGYIKDQEGFFNQDKNSVLLKDYKNKTEKTFPVTENVQDILSTFYFLRNHPNIDKLKVGESIIVDMFFDNETFKFKLKYIGKEDLKTKFGVIPSMIFRPLVQSGRVFKEQESLTVWISDDQNKLPIRIKASLAVGSLKADLDGFKGLKNPFMVKTK